MFANRGVQTPGSSFITPGFILQAKAWTRPCLTGASSCYFKVSNSSLCFCTRLLLAEKTVIIFWIACHRASQELAVVFDPKTWLVEIKYSFSAMYPMVPVKSAEICGKQKHAVMLARARWMISLGYVMCQLYMLMRMLILAFPKLMIALKSLLVLWFKTTLSGIVWVDESKITQNFPWFSHILCSVAW